MDIGFAHLVPNSEQNFEVDSSSMMRQQGKNNQSTNIEQRLTVSLKTLASMLDAHRSSVRRWLQKAGIRPLSLGEGRHGAIRYRWRDIESWLESMEEAD